jgi:pimeloyl-ACP methyl ester carboxylesterase
MVKVVNEDIGYMLGRVRASTLLVWGSEDDAVPLAHARTMESLIPDAGLVVFEGAGHFAYLDEPDRFCAIVRHFFGGS